MEGPSIPTIAALTRRAAHDLATADAQLQAATAHVDVLAAFASYALSLISGTGRNTGAHHDRPAPSAVELAAWKLYPEFHKCSDRDPDRIQAVIDALEVYVRAVSFSEMFPCDPEEAGDNDLVAQLRFHSGVVRGSAYSPQVVHRIAGVLRPFEAELAAHVGIGPCRSCELVTALGEQVIRNATDLKDSIREALAHRDALARKGVRIADAKLSTITQLDGEIQQLFAGMVGDWAATWSQIVLRLPDLMRSEWNAFRETIGLTPASRLMLTRAVDVQDRPVFYLDDERAFYAHGGACLDAVFFFFDDLARTCPAIRDRYGKCVAEWMESEIERFLQRLFPPAAILRNACFPDPDHPGGETEADVIVVWGPFLLIAEAKGRRVARDAMRGSSKELKKALTINIEDAFSQARRVVRVLEHADRIRFKERASGRTVEVDRARLKRVMAVSVTLQHLGNVAMQLAVTQPLGMFREKAYPWSVSIDDLDVITRFAGSPDVFLHYIDRRLAHQISDVEFVGDELDVFGQYLDNRLHPSLYEARPEIAEHAGGRGITFNGGEERFEPFYLAEWTGEPPPKEPIELAIPAQVRDLLNELRVRADDGSRWIAFALLGLTSHALNWLDAAIRDARHTSIEDRRVFRRTHCEGDIVINVLVHNSLDRITFRRNVADRSRLEHYRAKARATITIGIDQRDTARAFDVAHWLEVPWKQTDTMDRVLEAERDIPRLVQLPRNGTRPGRNEPCPCGSGKKFKRCCISRMTFQRAKGSQIADTP